MTAARPRWAEREPDEPEDDWLLRLWISHAAIAGHIRVRPQDTERNAS